MTAEVSVLVVEDDAMVRGWIRLSLRGSEFRIAGEAEDAAAAAELVARRRPDVLLIDYRLPDQPGTELVKRLRRRGDATPAIVMTANGERGFNDVVREAGGQGTVLKTGNNEELIEALRTVGSGLRSFDWRHPSRKPGEAALSSREREVIRLVADGATNRQVADTLGIGAESVKTILARMFAKLGVRKRAEAVARAHELGLL